MLLNSKPPESAYPFKDFELGYPSTSNRISLTGSWTNYSTQQKGNKMGSINLFRVKTGKPNVNSLRAGE